MVPDTLFGLLEFIEAYRDIIAIIKDDKEEVCRIDLLARLKKKYPPTLIASTPKLSSFGYLSLICTLVSLPVSYTHLTLPTKA